MNGYNTLVELLNSNTALRDIKIEGTLLIYQGFSIDIKEFNINYFLEQNSNFIKDLPSMTPETVFNIIKLHVTYANMEKREKEKEAQKYIEMTPLLNPFHIIKRTDSNKIDHSYIHYVDDNGNNHILADVSYEDLFLAYEEVLNSDSIIKTSKNIFDILRSKAQEITLEDLNTARERDDVKESHINNLEKLESDNRQAMELNYENMGNEEHSIYINNGNVVTIEETIDGTTTIEKHDSLTTTSGYQDSIVMQDKIELITWNEYVELIRNNEYLSPKDQDKKDCYESFLFDVILYHEYLTPELTRIYQNWVILFEQLYFAPVMTPVIEQTLKNYASMQEHSQNITITNAKEEVMKLERKNPDQKSTGYVNITVYIFLIILIGVVITSLVLVSP